MLPDWRGGQNTAKIGKVKLKYCNAKVAQLVEHDLAKVGVAGSNPVFRSSTNFGLELVRSTCPGGGIGRHVGLKIQWTLVRAGSSPAPGTKPQQ